MRKTKTPQAPKAAQRVVRTKLHGDVRVDEYSWLKNTKNPKVLNYIGAENKHTEKVMTSTRRLQKTLYLEMKKRLTEDDMSVPVKDGPYLYYVRMEKGKQHTIHCRKKSGAKEEIILDENKLAKGEKFFILGAFETSPDHSLLAYATDTTGNEDYTLYIKNLKTGRLFSDRIQSVGDVVWAEDGKHLFYSKEEHPFPPRKIYRHALGQRLKKDVLIFEEKNIQWYVNIGKSRSKKYIFIRCENFNTTEEYYIPTNKPLKKPRLILKRKDKVRYWTSHQGNYFYLATNNRAVNYKVFRRKTSYTGNGGWKAVLPHRKNRAILDLKTFKSFIILSVREEGSEWAYVYDTNMRHGRKIKLPENEHSLDLWNIPEYESPFVRFTYQSFLTPRAVYDYDVAKNKLTIRKRQKAPGWNKNKYISKRVWVKNGKVRIPVSLLYKKGFKRNGSAPLFLYAYGSYGICIDPAFSYVYQSLLDRGWVVAIASPRGGGEMGWQWHKDAHLLTKKRTFDDFIVCADYLVKEQYTSREKLTIQGGSAGGMLVGAVLNKRPDLCKAAIAYVPAADLIASLLDTSIAGTRLHFDETGNPREKKEYFYLKSYSPYENVRAKNYPALLVQASVHDIRTPFWEAAKWVARLRAKKTDSNTLLLKTEMAAGHFGKLGRYERLKERAFDYAFLISQVEKSKK